MTPDLHRVRRKLATLRAMVEGDMPVRTRWLALRLIDSSMTAMGPETPTPAEIEEAYVERHVCTILPMRRQPRTHDETPSDMTAHLYFEIPGTPEET